jgi:hypothetical protein
LIAFPQNVIASEAKQSIIAMKNGLLRRFAPRNDVCLAKLLGNRNRASLLSKGSLLFFHLTAMMIIATLLKSLFTVLLAFDIVELRKEPAEPGHMARWNRARFFGSK